MVSKSKLVGEQAGQGQDERDCQDAFSRFPILSTLSCYVFGKMPGCIAADGLKHRGIHNLKRAQLEVPQGARVGIYSGSCISSYCGLDPNDAVTVRLWHNYSVSSSPLTTYVPKAFSFMFRALDFGPWSIRSCPSD